MAKFIDLDTGLPALLNKVKAWVNSKLSAKQDTLTFDNTPTANSNNPVKSGGVYTALSGKQDTISDLSTIRTGAGKGVTAIQGIIVGSSEVTPDANRKVTIPAGTDGASAYEVAVDNGYTGTEAEWLASLKGDKGDTGNCAITGDGGNIVSIIVDDLTTGGSSNILSAEMGKVLKASIETLMNAIGEYAFPNGRPTISWSGAPVLSSPADNSSVNVGTIAYNGTSVTKTITVKGTYLTEALTVAITGTGLSVSTNSISAADANTGTTITVTYTNSATGAASTSGTLTISSSEVSASVALTASKAELTTYTITQNLTNVTSDCASASISSGSSLTIQLTAATGYTLNSVVVTMGGTDVTSTVYNSSTGVITIASVTGNIVVTAAATLYDAEIEYLECSGTQWIDTGIAVTGDGFKTEIKADVQAADSSWHNLFGARDASARYGIPFGAKPTGSGGTWYSQYGLGTYNNGVIADDSSSAGSGLHTMVSELSGNYAYLTIDGTTSSAVCPSNTYSNLPSLTLYLCGTHREDSTIVSISAKVYYCKMWDGDTLLADFIPVRVGQVGYFYDQVSGQLFGNIGTGSFTLGNDK